MRAAPPESLSRLPVDARAAEEVVCFGPQRRWTRAELLERGRRIAAAVSERGAGRWLVVARDGFEAAASLLGIGSAGGIAVLPPNQQAETLRRLARTAAGVVGSSALGEGLPHLDPDRLSDAPAAARPLEADAPWIELYSSGSGGQPRRHQKSVRHLDQEVQVLEQLFGATLGADARIFATAPHAHLYGLLFRLLWPLASGRSFQSDSCRLVQELLGRMAEAGRCALVSTPLHLRHAAASESLGALAGRCAAVFSSGSPLEASTALAVAECLGAAPVEVLGSTETGGVALRRRSPEDDSWSAFPRVRIEREADSGRLVVTSPFVSEGTATADGVRFRMGDRIELAPGSRFRLLDRADRVVKVGGKRLSLPEMERALSAHPWVREAALVVRELGGEPRVAAAVALNEAGFAALEEHGRRAVSRALVAPLAGFDAVLLPRAWRYLSALPRDDRGKLPAEAVARLFESECDAAEQECRRRIERRFTVPHDLAALEGHFEGRPLVPGVCQIGWALDAAAELVGSRPRLRRIEALKFPSVLEPGQTVWLLVEQGGARSAAGAVMRFSLRGGERVFASGRLCLEEGDEVSR